MLGLEGCGTQDGTPKTEEESPAHPRRCPDLCSHVPVAVGSSMAEAHGRRKVVAAWRYTEVETDARGEREEGGSIWGSGSSFRV